MSIPVRIQMTAGENGPTALFMMLGYFGFYADMKAVREVCVTSRNGSSPQQLIDAAGEFGLEGISVSGGAFPPETVEIGKILW